MTKVIDFKKYYEICQKFYLSNVVALGIDYNSFYDDVCKATIEEATKTKGSNYPPDRRFKYLLKNRYTDYLRNLKKEKIKPTSDNQIFDKSIKQDKDFHAVRISSDFITTVSTPLGKSIHLLNELIDKVRKIKISDKTIGSKFHSISQMHDITHFLFIPIDKILPIYKAKYANRQNRHYHKNRFQELLNNYEGRMPQSFTLISYDIIENNKPANFYIKKGYDARDTAIKTLNKAKMETDVKAFFICYLYFLKANIFFQKALDSNLDNESDINIIPVLYNQAYIQKRLGFLNESKIKLKELINKELSIELKSAVFECLGDTHLLQGELKQALKYFKKALKLIPNEQEVNFNILQTYYELDELNGNNDNIAKVHNTLKKLLIINKQTQKMRLNLLNKIMHKYKGDVAYDALLVTKLK